MRQALGAIPLLMSGTVVACWIVAIVLVGALWSTRTRLLALPPQLLLATVAVVAAVLCWWLVDHVWIPVADGVGVFTWTWVGVIVLVTLQVFVGPWRGRGWLGLVAGLVAILVMVLVATVAVNAHFRTYPTVADALGWNIDAVPLSAVDLGPVSAPTVVDGPLDQGWRAPAGMAERGTVVTAAIPATGRASTDAGGPAFTPREAYIYLPPAYFTEHRPLLPVLVLLAGVPGQPRDWLTGGQLRATMDQFAAAHDGLAPVVIVPDPIGSTLANPLCSDTSHGDVATYLQRDVPDWITTTLQVDPDHQHWAIGGISNGGTCTMQVVTRAPEVYPSFLDLSGEPHPTLGPAARTLARGFDGDPQLQAANDPFTLMERRSYPQVAGIVSVGRNDAVYRASQHEVYRRARAAGMQVQMREYDGGHAWTLWAGALRDQLPWLSERLGLTAAS